MRIKSFPALFIMLLMLQVSYGETSVKDCLVWELYGTATIEARPIIEIQENKIVFQQILKDHAGIGYRAFKAEMNGHPVKVKEFQSSGYRSHLGFSTYDYYATRYHRSMGLDKHMVKPILMSRENEASIIQVFEYVEGAHFESPQEILQKYGKKKGNALLNRWKQLKERFEKNHRGFRAWMKEKKPEFTPRGVVEELMDNGDFKLSNFIYSEKLDRWICMDP